MYTVKDTGEKFNSYFLAIAAATAIGSDVLDKCGVRRWTPATPPTAKKLRKIKEQQAAYDAQEKAKGSK